MTPTTHRALEPGAAESGRPPRSTASLRELSEVYVAVASLGQKHLPTKEARINVALCIRRLKKYHTLLNDQRQEIKNTYLPLPTEVADGEEIKVRNPMMLARELLDLELVEIPFAWPERITPQQLPQNDKAHPNNEDGLALIVAELGPLYELLDDDSDDVDDLDVVRELLAERRHPSPPPA